MARSIVWNWADKMYNLKERREHGTFFLLFDVWCFPAPSTITDKGERNCI